MKFKAATVGLVCFLIPCLLRADLLVNQYDTNLHDRFTNSSQFAGNPYDWSGVGKKVTGGGGQWATAVSDSFALSVSHASPAVGAVIRFYHTNDPNGAFEERTVAETFSYTGVDLRLIRFDTVLSLNVEKYSVLDAPRSYAPGLDLHVFGLASATTFAPETRTRYGTNSADIVAEAGLIDGIGYDALLWDYDVSEGQGEARVAGGDSGAPTFVVESNAPVLIGLHNFRYDAEDGSSGSGDVFLPTYIDRINGDLAGFGESLSLVAVPEPSGTAAVVLLLGLVFRRNRTRLA